MGVPVNGHISVFSGFLWLLLLLASQLGAVDGLRFDTYEVTRTPGWQERRVDVQFPFTNTSDRPIAISGVHTSCGCVATAPVDTVIQPGQRSAITAAFTFGSRVGRQVKAIRVETNDPQSPSIGLTLTVDIPRIVTLEPALVRWTVGDSLMERRIRVTLTQDVPVAISGVDAPSSLITTQWLADPAGTGGTLVLTPVATTTTWQAAATIRTSIGRDFVVFARCMSPTTPGEVATSAADVPPVPRDRPSKPARELTENPPSVRDAFPADSFRGHEAAASDRAPPASPIPRVQVGP